ncbi:hypothetical protein BST61_g9519 [Cercospora zeina]
MHWLSIFLLLCTITRDASANYPFPQNPKPLHEVFQVDLRYDPAHPERYPSSCGRLMPGARIAQTNPFGGRPIYDPHVDFHKRDANMLNHIWYQAYAMLSAARAAIWPGNYALPQTYSLVFSFFGLYPDLDADDKEPEGGDKVFLDVLRARYEGVQKTMEHAQVDGRLKPKLFCGGAYWEMQFAGSPARQRDGNIIKHRDGTPTTLQEWEKLNGRNFGDSWYLWFDIDFPSGKEKGYIVLDKEEYPPGSASLPYPWPLASNGQPDFCRLEIYAQVLHMTTPPTREGTDAWHVADHVILCPRSFDFEVNINDIDRTTRQTEGTNGQGGTHIDTLEVPGTTLLHELHHVAFKDFSNDVRPWFPKRVPDNMNGVISKDFPHLKSGFTQSRVRGAAQGATQSMSIALYEQAEPWTSSNAIRSIFAPESAAWFARATHLTMQTRQDWSTGFCQPWDTQPLQGPLAPIVESCLEEVTGAKFFDSRLQSNISITKAAHGVRNPWEVPLCDIFRQVMARSQIWP